MSDQNWLNAVRFKKFSLHNPGGYSVLPERYGLVFDRLTGTLTLVNWKQEQFIAVCSSLNEEQIALYEQARERVEPLFQALWERVSGCQDCLNNLGIDIVALMNYGWLIVGFRP